MNRVKIVSFEEALDCEIGTLWSPVQTVASRVVIEDDMVGGGTSILCYHEGEMEAFSPVRNIRIETLGHYVPKRALW